MLDRRNFLRAGMACAAGMITASPFTISNAVAASDTWPSRAIKLVVPFAPGGPTDFIARLVAEPLSANLGQPVVIENRAGAGGNVGAQAVAGSPPDGHTLLHSTVAMLAVNPLLYPTPNFDPLRDLTTVGTTAALPNVLIVNPTTTDVHSVQELVALAKSRPDGLNYATFGAGTSPHILGALFQKLAGFSATAVPYRGSAPALMEIVGGRVDFLFDSITTSLEQIKAGAVRCLAVTSAQRSPLLPNVPTMTEAGFPGFDLEFWFSIQAPAGLAAEPLARLQAALKAVQSETAFVEALRNRGAQQLSVPPDQLKAFVDSRSARWTAVAKDLQLKAN